MQDDIAVFLCERSGNMARPWCEAGIKCVTVDLQPATWVHPNRTHIVRDVKVMAHSIATWNVRFIAAFPPCTHLSSSGARWWKDKGLRALIEGLELVEACREICEGSGAPYMIENPIGRLATCWRQPDYSFHPVHYAGYAADPEGDEYTKKTCLWTGNGFIMPDRKPGHPTLGSKMHRLSPSADRADQRSETPIGFATAVFQANQKRIKVVSRAKAGAA